MVASSAAAYSGGIAGYAGNAAGTDCSACHTASGAAPTVTIAGPSTLSLGAVGSYTLTLTGGPGVKGGLDVAVDSTAALLHGDGSTTKVMNKDVTHLSPR